MVCLWGDGYKEGSKVDTWRTHVLGIIEQGSGVKGKGSNLQHIR